MENEVPIAPRIIKEIPFNISLYEEFERTSDTDSLYSKIEKIGAYVLSVRSSKILKYKSKLTKRRALRPISKKFSGRS